MEAEAHIDERSEKASNHLQRVAHEVRDMKLAHTALADVCTDANNGRCLETLQSEGNNGNQRVQYVFISMCKNVFASLCMS